MKYYNVYSDDSVRAFDSKEEADLKDNRAWWDDSYPGYTRVYRYGCWEEPDYNKLRVDRDTLFDLNKVMSPDCDNKIKIAMWTAYSRFWFEHRNVEREE